MSLDDLKQKIKEEIPISSVIGNYLSIKRSGSAMVSLCPFHGDTKPSMNINDSKKIFKCFACGAAGDAITFVMKHRNLDYVEALKEICQKQGINFDSYQEERKVNPKMEMAKKILTRAALLYRKIGASNQFPPYTSFIKNRGLNDEIATTYSLGFAPNKSSITDYLKSIPDPKDRDFAISVALDIGLIRRDKNNPDAQYDTFRDRIIFPIWDQFGQVVGFTSRAIRDDQKAKYMNSVESFVFNKSNILYGFHLAKNAIREKDSVILVEGNMDQIALYHNGFLNTVAVMGVALGTSSLERIISLTKNVYLALDSDRAGFIAMERINKQLAEKGIVAKYLDFSPQKDPDDYLKAHGALALQEKIENAIPAIDVLLNNLIPEKLPEVLDRKLEILHKAFDVVAPLRSDLSATERVVGLAKRLGLKAEPSQIIKNYEDHLSKSTDKPKFIQPKKEVIEDSGPMYRDEDFIPHEDNETPFDIEVSAPEIYLSKMEKLLVQELVQLPSLLNMDKMNEILDLVTNDEVKKYIGKIRRITMEVDDREYESVVLNLTNTSEYSIDLREVVTSAFYNYKPKDADKKTKLRILFDLKNKLHTEQLKNRKEEIKKLQQTCDSEEVMTGLLNQLTEIEKTIQIIKNSKPEKSN
ncbi:DNA primase [Bacteriovorax sp. PP10]|uniref:DNA primase n=1 Tax=Bacteriovorax antarcticus TaxID=3088717 RepID=A0ABU5VUG1_9BACT|nr:DNA primase [Bacteriovorax sp. PP10]MEA9356674.1 DNA primase [Bacteriovorax sp. PP10]